MYSADRYVGTEASKMEHLKSFKVATSQERKKHAKAADAEKNMPPAVEASDPFSALMAMFAGLTESMGRAFEEIVELFDLGARPKSTSSSISTAEVQQEEDEERRITDKTKGFEAQTRAYVAPRPTPPEQLRDL